MTIRDMESVLKGYKWAEEGNGLWHKDGRVFTLRDDGFVYYEGEGIANGPNYITIYFTNGRVEIGL